MDIFRGFFFFFFFFFSYNVKGEELIDQLLKRIDALESNGRVQQAVIAEQEMRLSQLEQKCDKDKHDRPERFIMAGTEGPVAFHATVEGGRHTHIGLQQKVQFTNVFLNTGNAYHAGAGLFIAPQKGLYLFSTSIMSAGEIHVDIVKNNTQLAGAYSKLPGLDQGSVTLVTQLDAADEMSVVVRRPADTSIYGDHLSSFMGCLLIPL